MARKARNVLTIDALDAGGGILQTRAVDSYGDRDTVHVYNALSPVDASGSGAGRSADFTPVTDPMFPSAFVHFSYVGTDPVSVDLVCDTGTVAVIRHLDPQGSIAILQMPEFPEGWTTCHFEVDARGPWTLSAR